MTVVCAIQYSRLCKDPQNMFIERDIERERERERANAKARAVDSWLWNPGRWFLGGLWDGSARNPLGGIWKAMEGTLGAK